MGDRSAVVIRDKDGMVSACALYTHWQGEVTLGWLKEAIPSLCKDDVDYAMAGLIGFFYNKMGYYNRTEGSESLGVMLPPKDLTRDTLESYSPGDAGVIVYTCDTGEIEAYGGYATRQLWGLPLYEED